MKIKAVDKPEFIIHIRVCVCVCVCERVFVCRKGRNHNLYNITQLNALGDLAISCITNTQITPANKLLLNIHNRYSCTSYILDELSLVGLNNDLTSLLYRQKAKIINRKYQSQQCHILTFSANHCLMA